KQPRVLHRDDRLRREVLKQRDFFICKWPDLTATGGDHSEKRIVSAQRDEQSSTNSLKLDPRLTYGIVDCRPIGDLEKPGAVEQWANNGPAGSAVTLSDPVRECFRIAARRHRTECLAVIKL